jgi:hypothetical protein
MSYWRKKNKKKTFLINNKENKINFPLVRIISTEAIKKVSVI